MTLYYIKMMVNLLIYETDVLVETPVNNTPFAIF